MWRSAFCALVCGFVLSSFSPAAVSGAAQRIDPVRQPRKLAQAPKSGENDASAKNASYDDSGDEAQQSADKPQSQTADDEKAAQSTDKKPSQSTAPNADALPGQKLTPAEERQYSYNPAEALKDDEIGKFYLRRGNPAGAALRYEDALKYNPDDAEAMFGAGEAEQRLQHYQQAERYFSRYLEVVPDGKHSNAARKHLAEADAHLDAPATKKPSAKKSEHVKASHGGGIHGDVKADTRVTPQ